MKNEKWVTVWKSVLSTIEMPVSMACPIEELVIANFKHRSGLLLPDSYYGFCQTFGPGLLTDWEYRICMPDARSEHYSIEALNNLIKMPSLIWANHSHEAQLQRSYFFGSDICTSRFFWDPLDVTSHKTNEYGIYIIHREREIERLADTFIEFIDDVCLGKGIPGYDYSNGVERFFYPDVEHLKAAEDKKENPKSTINKKKKK